ncbi:PQQ-binding-like beta-propeller repeat protein [Streptomyces sp. NPDC012421]|uniref:outer membrane protein assembly factor BamB family protein n=1 Tax=Streptomyces sp. NPDC012421 TaxID=3364832 RepID=UPI0036E209F6
MSPRQWRSVLGCLTAFGVLLAIVFGFAWVFLGNSGYWPGSSMTTAWATPRDDQAPEDSVHRAWRVDDVLVRARYDEVTGFDAGSSQKRWAYTAPLRTAFCAASTTADGSRVLLAYGAAKEGQEGCGTVVALDLADGRELWHTALAPASEAFSGGNGPLDPEASSGGDGALAVGNGLGVILDGGTGRTARAIRALDLRTGSPRWTATVPKGCVPGPIASAAKQVVAVLACGKEMKLAAFDPADGEERWTTPLDARSGVLTDASVTITATEPMVLRVDEGDRGIEAFLTFGPDGRPGAALQVTGADYGSIGTDVAVSDGRLFAFTNGGESGFLAAFDLTTGHQLWKEGLDGSPFSADRGLHAEAGRVMFVNNSRHGDSLYVFDAATGDEKEHRDFRDDTEEVDDLLPYEDRIIAVRSGSYNEPFTGYERW